jgi:hypothetical protein
LVQKEPAIPVKWIEEEEDDNSKLEVWMKMKLGSENDASASSNQGTVSDSESLEECSSPR